MRVRYSRQLKLRIETSSHTGGTYRVSRSMADKVVKAFKMMCATDGVFSFRTVEGTLHLVRSDLVTSVRVSRLRVGEAI